jgi:hypothetical protein
MSNPEGEWLVDDPEFWRSSLQLQRPPAAPAPAPVPIPKKPEGKK